MDFKKIVIYSNSCPSIFCIINGMGSAKYIDL